jgi:putative two-component system response regulator
MATSDLNALMPTGIPSVLGTSVLGTVESLMSLVDQALPASGPSCPSAGPKKAAAKIMIVDDEPINIMVVKKYLETAGFANLASTSDSRQAFAEICRERPDVLLLDIMMPHVDGLEILRQVRAERRVAQLPVIILTAVDDRQVKAAALELGATDFLTKPVDPMELVPRVRNSLAIKTYQDDLARQAQALEHQVQQRTEELAVSRLDVIHCLGRAAEFRDNDTGMHVVRVGQYAAIIARQLGLDDATVELIEHAAPLHDLGKIGIPDAILLKQGKLDPEEFRFMKRHCEFGLRIVEETSQEERRLFPAPAAGRQTVGISRSPTLRMAGLIALTHHEKWDGSGYPFGLRGEEIPVEGRITAVADVFDALSSQRPYKPAFPVDKCFAMLEEGRGRHFDPRVLDAFFACKEEVLTVFHLFADQHSASAASAPAGEAAAGGPLVSALPTDDPAIHRIVERFADRLGERLEAGRRAWQAGRLNEVALLASWLHGASLAAGFPALAAHAERLEALADAQSLPEIGALLQQLAELPPLA